MTKFVCLALALIAPVAAGQLTGSSQIAGPSHDGQEITCDLPPQEQFKNVGSKKDGAGMCVFTSIEMAARYQGLEQMRGWRDWCAANYTGGGWPQRVDQLLAAWGKHKNITIPPYYQYEGKDPSPILSLVDKTGRMASITYGYSPRYGGQIAHMVCCPAFRANGKYGVVLDNNFVAQRAGDGWKEDIFEWMPQAELVRRMKLTGGTAWAFVWLTSPPPPPPRNLKLPT